MGVIGGYEDLRGEGAVGAPVMDALREPTRCAAVVVCWCVCACVSCGVILSGRAERSGVRRLERQSGTGRWRRQPWATPAASTTKHESVLCVCVQWSRRGVEMRCVVRVGENAEPEGRADEMLGRMRRCYAGGANGRAGSPRGDYGAWES